MERRNLVVGTLGSLVTLAAAGGLFVVLDKDSITLPDEIDGFTKDPPDLKNADAYRERAQRAADYNSEQWSALLDGAAVDTAAYVNAPDYEQFRTVIAARTDIGPLLAEDIFREPDPAVPQPRIEWAEEDDVVCLLVRFPQGQDDYPDNPDSMTCQRNTAGLSVRVLARGEGLTEREVRDFFDDAWDAVD